MSDPNSKNICGLNTTSPMACKYDECDINSSDKKLALEVIATPNQRITELEHQMRMIGVRQTIQTGMLIGLVVINLIR